MAEQRTREIHGHVRAFRVLGTGRTVLLLLHGIGSSSATWDAVAPGLAERYTVIVPDLLGHGGSAKPRGDYSIGGYANGMRDLLGVLGIDRVTVIGHSFGGGVAMQVAYQFPERTDRVVLVASGGLGPEISPVLRALTLPGAATAVGLSHLPPSRLLLGLVRAAAGAVLPTSLAADLDEALTVHAALRDPATRAAFMHVLRHITDWRGQLITMRDRAYLAEGLPTLVVWGEQDHVLPVEHAYEAARLIPGSRCLVLPGVGHMPHRQVPERFVRAVTDFVTETRPKRWDARRWLHLLRSGRHGSPEPPACAPTVLPSPVRVNGTPVLS